MTQTLPAPEQPGGIAAVGDRYVAVVTVAERVMRVYDAKTGEALGETPAGIGPTHIETIGEYAYVADTEGDMVRKFLIGPEPREVAAVPGRRHAIRDRDRPAARAAVGHADRNQSAGRVLDRRGHTGADLHLSDDSTAEYGRRRPVRR